MSTSLEEDLLEIEQTLRAVEQQRLSSQTAVKSKVASFSRPKFVSNINKATRSFRGINKISQGPKKSVLLNRRISLSVKNKPVSGESSDNLNSKNSHNTKLSSEANNIPKDSIERLLPSMSSILQGKIKLKAAKLSSSKQFINSSSKPPTETINKNNSKPNQLLIANKSAESKRRPLDYKLKLSQAKKGKLVHKFNNKNSRTNKIEDSSSVILVKSARVKKHSELSHPSHIIRPSSISLQHTTPKPKLNNNKFNAPHLIEKSLVASTKHRPEESHALTRSSIKPPQSRDSARSHNLKEQLIKNALREVPMDHYHDHDRQKSLKKKYKIRSIRNLSLVAFVLLFSGYIFFLNIPSISFRVAAIQAGMSSTAAIPTYKPAGYSLSSRASYGPGYVKIELKNNGGNKLSLTQEKSSFDSEALKDNVVARTGNGYSTYVKDGLTIYLYNKGGASWVNKGQVYSLNGDTSDLSSDEILNMAVSM